MDVSAAALWEWTKIFVRSPRTASALVKAQHLPINVSVIMIALAGVMSGAMTGVLQAVNGVSSMVVDLPDGQQATITEGGALIQGAAAIFFGLALGLAIFQIGRRMGGTGSLAQILSLVALLQMVMTVIVVGRTVALLVLPPLGFGILIFGLYVFFRGLGHVVNVGHDLEDMGKSAGVIALSFLALFVGLFILVAILGISPQGVVQ